MHFAVLLVGEYICMPRVRQKISPLLQLTLVVSVLLIEGLGAGKRGVCILHWRAYCVRSLCKSIAHGESWKAFKLLDIVLLLKLSIFIQPGKWHYASRKYCSLLTCSHSQIPPILIMGEVICLFATWSKFFDVRSFFYSKQIFYENLSFSFE